MAKVDKEFYARMQGLLYAEQIVKDAGLEGLRAEIKRRNVTRIPLSVSKAECDKVYSNLCENVYNNMLTTVYVTLNEEFGFGMKRLTDFKEAFNQKIQNTFDLDYMGEHYVSMEDYAVDMNERFNAGIDVNRVAAAQDHFDERERVTFRMVKSEKIVEILNEAGFEDAAEFIRKKIG